MRRRLVVTFLFLAVVAGCSARRGPAPREVSGFLDDYSLLRAGAPGEVALVSRNPKADWASYDKVLLEPITLWRSGRKSLDAVPEQDLLRLVDGLESAVRRRLGEGFRLVEEPGPGVMRIRLGITEARASDPILDVLRARGEKRGDDHATHPIVDARLRRGHGRAGFDRRAPRARGVRRRAQPRFRRAAEQALRTAAEREGSRGEGEGDPRLSGDGQGRL